MPIYDYQCPHCGIKTNVWAHINDDCLPCPDCGQPMTRLISPAHIIPDIEPYQDKEMGHEPVVVKSRQHKKQLLRERGLIERG